MIDVPAEPFVLFVLQNAWRHGAVPGETDDRLRRAWSRLLWRSQTGKRLQEMIPEGIEYGVVNASPFVGSTSGSIFAADKVLMTLRLVRYRPHLVVLCGKVAEQLAPLLDEFGQGYLVTPHPAWRMLSKEQTASIKQDIEIATRDSFPVTDDLMDAPDGAVVDGYKRVGDQWERVS